MPTFFEAPKIKLAESLRDDEPNMNFFERHPKKILAAGGILGAIALRRALKKGGVPKVTSSTPKPAASAPVPVAPAHASPTVPQLELPPHTPVKLKPHPKADKGLRRAKRNRDRRRDDRAEYEDIPQRLARRPKGFSKKSSVLDFALLAETL